MTQREQIEAVLRGKTPDRIPFAPFSELIPRASFERSYREQGMGFIVHSGSVSSTTHFPTVERTENGCSTLTRETPWGNIQEEFRYQQGASNDGRVQTGFAIREESDYGKVISWLDSMEFASDHSGEALMDFYLGDEGVTHAWTGEPPYMGAQYYLGLENWAYHQADYPDKFAALLAALDRMQEKNLHCHAQGNQTMFNLGNLAGNFSPEAFRVHMLPYFQKYADLMHRAGKLVTVHADASNLREHTELVSLCEVDIVEAFTPPPVGNLTLADARKAWGEKTTILINFPETVFYGGYREVIRYTRALLESDPCPNKIIGLTEMGFIGANPKNMHMIRDGIQAVLDVVNNFNV